MKDSIAPSGRVEIQVIKKDGTVIDKSGHNEIHAELKREMAESMFSAQGNFGIQGPAVFDDATFTTTIPNGESGIIIKDTGGELYQMATTMTASPATSFTVKGEVRNDGASKTISDAYLGHDTATEDFGVQYSTYDFSDNGGDQAVADGDQLNITWTITIADS